MAGLTAALIATGVSTAVSAAGVGIGARKRKKALKEQQRMLDGMKRDNEGDFLRDYYQDAFDDPSARSYLKNISEQVYDQNRGIENNGVATGATHENVLARKQAANRVMDGAVNNVVVNHEARKQAARSQYLERKDAIARGNVEMAAQKGEMQAQAWQGGANVLGGAISSAGSILGTPKSMKVPGSVTQGVQNPIPRGYFSLAKMNG